MFSIDERAHRRQPAAIDSAELRGNVQPRCAPSRTIEPPADDHVADVGGGRGEDDATRARDRRVGPARRTPSRPTVTRSASAPGPIAPASGQPMQAQPAAVAARSSAAAAWCSALAGLESLVELDRPRLLEHVDRGVRVGAERELGARPRPGGAPGRPRPRGRARSSGRGRPCSPAAEQRRSRHRPGGWRGRR